MKRLTLILAGLAFAGVLPGGTMAAERSPYDTNPDCMRRDAKAADCVIDNGPRTGRVVQQPAPAPSQPGAPAPAPQPSQIKR